MRPEVFIRVDQTLEYRDWVNCDFQWRRRRKAATGSHPVSSPDHEVQVIDSPPGSEAVADASVEAGVGIEAVGILSAVEEASAGASEQSGSG